MSNTSVVKGFSSQPQTQRLSSTDSLFHFVRRVSDLITLYVSVYTICVYSTFLHRLRKGNVMTADNGWHTDMQCQPCIVYVLCGSKKCKLCHNHSPEVFPKVSSIHLFLVVIHKPFGK